jgi:hypothetical protein
MAVNRLADLDFIFPKFFKKLFQSRISCTCFAALEPGKSAKNRINMSILRTQVEIRFFNTVNGVTVKSCFVVACWLFLIALFACGKENTPAGILPKEKMVQVLTEIYIAEEKLNRMGLPRDTAQKRFEAVEDKIYEKTGVTDSLFKTSYDYYMNRPSEMELIYTALVDSMQLLEQRAPTRVNEQ